MNFQRNLVRVRSGVSPRPKIPHVDGCAEHGHAELRFAVYGEVVYNDLLQLFHPGDSVLDIGCGSGAWAPALRSRGAHTLTGVEISPTAADRAEARYDEILREPVEALELSGRGFSTIIAADVLEHLVNPWGELARWARWVRPGGQLVVSVPNLQSLDLLGPLVRGRFDYRDGGGMMDRTHLRWFTHASLCDALLEAGWWPERWGRTVGKRGAVDRLARGKLTAFLQPQIRVVARAGGGRVGYAEPRARAAVAR